jgi:hypothetical protein
MGATFSRVIDNMKTKHEVESKPLKDEHITHFEFVIEDDIIEESIVSIIPIIEPINKVLEPIIQVLEPEELIIQVPEPEEPIIQVLEPIIQVLEPIIQVSMDIKDLMKEIIAEALSEEPLPTVSDRKLRKRRKKSL